MIRFLVHYGCHFVIPILVAFLFFKPHWKKAALFMMLAIVIDIDHVLATPVFDPDRCSIGFHPLHSYYAIAVYLALSIFKPTRIFGIGLLIHMVADSLDCMLM